MKVLIVESRAELSRLWAGYLLRNGAEVQTADGESSAIRVLGGWQPDVIVLDLVLDTGSAFAVADFASYSMPTTRVVFVTNTTFFSDGSIFNHIPNACAFLPSATEPEDLAAVVKHYSAVH